MDTVKDNLKSLENNFNKNADEIKELLGGTSQEANDRIDELKELFKKALGTIEIMNM